MSCSQWVLDYLNRHSNSIYVWETLPKPQPTNPEGEAQGDALGERPEAGITPAPPPRTLWALAELPPDTRHRWELYFILSYLNFRLLPEPLPYPAKFSSPMSVRHKWGNYERPPEPRVWVDGEMEKPKGTTRVGSGGARGKSTGPRERHSTHTGHSIRPTRRPAKRPRRKSNAKRRQ